MVVPSYAHSREDRRGACYCHASRKFDSGQGAAMRVWILLGGVALAIGVAGQTTPAPAAPFSVVEATITDMQKAMQAHRVTSHDLVQQYLTRIALYDKPINAA